MIFLPAMLFNFRKARLVAIALFLLLAACEAQESIPVPVAPAESTVVIPEIRPLSEPRVVIASQQTARERFIADTLYEALQALDDDRLLKPADDSAHGRFKRILAMDPGNEIATDGLERIVLRYVELSLEASRRGLFVDAGELLENAKFVDLTHESGLGNEQWGSSASFFDADNDKDLDLYVVSGGNEFPLRYKSIRDRLYILNDKGIYELDTFSLPEIYQNGSIVRASDFDNDGDVDLFLGGRSIPGKYGFPPKHYLLENDGKGKFWINDKITFENQGMVTDATWVDIDNDGWMDLFVCGDWSDIKFYKNIQGSLIEDNKNYSLNKNGWWFSIKSADINNDGLMDLIAGNIGLNIKFKPSVNFPVKMYIDDFDNNESFEQIVTYIRNGKEYPLADRDEITKQLNYLKRKFLYFKNFAGQEIKDIFSKSQLDNSKILFANEFQSFVFLNNGKKFEAKPLPIIAQSSSISVIETCDFNSDNILDLLIFGNKNFVSTYFGSFDANHGILLKGKGDGTFDYVDQKKSGLNVRGEIKKMFYLDKNKTKFVLGVNDNELNFYKLNSL